MSGLASIDFLGAEYGSSELFLGRSPIQWGVDVSVCFMGVGFLKKAVSPHSSGLMKCAILTGGVAAINFGLLDSPLARLGLVALAGKAVYDFSSRSKVHREWKKAGKELDQLAVCASSLMTVSQVHALENCQYMSACLQALVVRTDKVASRLKSREGKLRQEIICINEEHVSTNQSQREYREKIAHSKESLDGYREEKNGLDKRRDSLGRQLRAVEQELEDVKKEEQEMEGVGNKFLDTALWIVTLGYDSLTQRLADRREKATAALEKTGEEIGGLQKRICSASNKIKKAKKELQRCEAKVSELAKRKLKKEKEIKNLGKRITSVNNLLRSLRELLSQYDFLSGDTQRIKRSIEHAQLTQRRVDRFLSKVSRAQDSFSAIEEPTDLLLGPSIWQRALPWVGG